MEKLSKQEKAHSKERDEFSLRMKTEPEQFFQVVPRGQVYSTNEVDSERKLIEAKVLHQPCVS